MIELTPEQQYRAEALFEQVLDIDPESRRSYLDSSGSEPAVRAEVESLLSFHPDACRRLDTPVVPPEALLQAVDELVFHEATARPEELDPKSIGPYHIVGRIGEGGMGTVYLAEQEKPLRRRVAVKLIKLGMDTRTVLARFDAERQALALMNHPNVARALDAGSTEDGRPYFVMEYVEGDRITEYCDTNRLHVSARLALFRRVCDAIQHAHQKGVIHRDIKPSNVIVCRENGNPVPKVIDFGVAKATNQLLTERTVFTEQGVLIGTPEYMSPEQARIDNSDVDTRSDIYSLGVLLYELLVGVLPIDTEALRRTGIDELLRLVREHDPPKPTTRLAVLGDQAVQCARQRSTELSTLIRKIRGDLDWIVMKCLEKDPNRRYATIAAFVDDLDRYAQHQPVAAGPPSASYRLRKFARRHRALVVGAAAVSITLLAGVISTAIFAVRESRQHAAAQAQADTTRAVNAFLNDMLSSVDPRNAGPEVTVREVLDEAAGRVEAELAGHPEVERNIRGTIGRAYMALGIFDEALPHFERSLTLAVELYGDQSEESAASLNELGYALKQMGRFADAEGLHRRALEIEMKLFGENDTRAAASMNHLAQSLYDQGKYDDGRPLFERAFEIRKREPGQQDLPFITSLSNLARARYTSGDYAEAVRLQKEALRLMTDLFGESHPDTVGQMNNVAFLTMTNGQYQEAEAMFREVVGHYRTHYGQAHPDIARSLNNLGECLRRQDRYEDAAAIHREALAMRRELLGTDHPMVAKSLNNLALALTSLERYEQAAALHAESLTIRKDRLGGEHPDIATTLNNLAFVQYKQGAYEQAEARFREALRIRQSAYGNDHPQVANTQMNLARCLLAQGNLEDAETLCRAALRIQSETLGESHPDTAATSGVLGRVLTQMSHYDEAETVLLHAHASLRSRFPPDSKQIHGIRDKLVELYEAWERPEEADRYRHSASTTPP